MAKDIRDKSDVECKCYESSEDVPDSRELSSQKRNLMVFDYLLLEKQITYESYYVRGRHSNVDCFYSAQNYFKLSRQTIRENANFICLFSQDQKNLNHIFDDNVESDMTKEEFRQLCKILAVKKNKGKYRSGLDQFYIKKETYFLIKK